MAAVIPVDNDSEWEKCLRGVPDFDIAKLKHYLITNRNKTFDKDGIRAYKSLKAYKFFEEGYVQKIMSLQKNNNFYVRAEVMASMARKVYKTNVCFSSEGNVDSASCNCVAGKGEACSHIAALLFAVDDFVAKGYKDLPADKSVTDVLCEWNKPAKRAVEPKTVHDIRVVKQEHGKTPKERKTLHTKKFDPRQEKNRTRNEDSFKNLVEALSEAYSSCGFMKYNTTMTSSSSCTDQNREETQLSSKELHLPPSLQEIKTACEKLKTSLQLSTEEL